MTEYGAETCERGERWAQPRDIPPFVTSRYRITFLKVALSDAVAPPRPPLTPVPLFELARSLWTLPFILFLDALSRQPLTFFAKKAINHGRF